MRILLDVANGNIADGAFFNMPALIILGVCALFGLAIVAGIIVAIVLIVRKNKKQKQENGEA